MTNDDGQALIKANTGKLNRLYFKYETDKAAFDYFASRKNRMRVTTVEELCNVLTRQGHEVSNVDVRQFLMDLSRLGLGLYVKGARGHHSRMEWNVDTVALGKVAGSKAPDHPIDDDHVTDALRNLRDALEKSLKRSTEKEIKAVEERNYLEAKEAQDNTGLLTDLLKRVKELEKECAGVQRLHSKTPAKAHKKGGRAFLGRKRRGGITPQREYFRYILETLVEIGGRGDMTEVLDRVGDKMKDVLIKPDYERCIVGKMIRWRNNAQWARNFMVNKDGLMKKNSPRGIWEISDAGRTWLENNSTSKNAPAL